MMGRPADQVTQTRGRLARYWLCGLWREAELDVLEHAVAAGVLERVEHPHGLSVFRKGKAISAWTFERVTLFIRRVFRSGFSRPKTDPARQIEWETDDSDDNETTIPFGIGLPLKAGSGQKTLLDRQCTLTLAADAPSSDAVQSAAEAEEPGGSASDVGEASEPDADSSSGGASGTAALAGGSTRKAGATRRRRRPVLDRMALIRLVRDQATPPSSVQVATLLMLTDAVARSGHSLAEVLAILRRPKPIIAITGTVAGFEVAFVDLLKRGLVLPGRSTLINGYNLRSINDVRHGDDARRSLIVFGAREIEEAEFLRKQVDLAAQNANPVLAVADAPEQLPAALCDAADLHLVCSPISESLIAEILKVVLWQEPRDLPLGNATRGGANRDGIAPHTTSALDDQLSGASPLDGCALLSLFHLGLAIRPGMSADACLKHLRALIERQQAHEAGESNAGKTAKSSGSPGRTTSSRRGKVGSGNTIIEPEPLDASQDACGKQPLRVETLSGYVAASDWALDLKQDLALWTVGQLEWSEMSTRLLLAGPPGTGKTTFARALANTLPTKLLVTSVGTWLEPSHLGDVLARMSAAFVEAEAHAPCILFVDEIDGIGRRGSGRREYDDYWTSVVNRALELVDGSLKTEGVIIVGATNNPDAIDSALLRSGRLETRIDIPLPDVDALVGILRHHLRDDAEGLEAIVEAEVVAGVPDLETAGESPPSATQTVARRRALAAGTSAASPRRAASDPSSPVSRMLASLWRVVRRWPRLSHWWPASLTDESKRQVQDGGK